jgi:hypothetical protein
MKDAADNIVAVGPLSFLAAVAEGMRVLAAPVWVAGLVFFLILPAGSGRRAMGWTSLVVLVMLTFSHAAR